MTEPAPSLVGAAMGQARANWHPQVHRLYDEDLFYFLLRFSQTRNVQQILQDIMAESGIRFYCAYAVTGYYDAVVRFWATPQYKRRLLKAITRARGEVATFQEFQASEIYYDWSETSNQRDLFGDLRCESKRSGLGW